MSGFKQQPTKDPPLPPENQASTAETNTKEREEEVEEPAKDETGLEDMTSINWQNIFFIFMAVTFIYNLVSNFFFIWLGTLIPIIFTVWLSFYFRSPSDSTDKKDTRSRSRTQNSKLATKFKRFQFTNSQSWKFEIETLANESNVEELNIYPENFLINETLNQLINSIIKTFVESWFERISPTKAFIVDLQHNFENVIKHLQVRLHDTDFTDLVVYRIVPQFNDHFNNFVMAHDLVKNKKTVINRSLTNTWDLDNIIATNFNKGKLHPTLKVKGFDREKDIKIYMAKIISKILPYLLIEEDLDSPPVSFLVREIVTNCVLFPVIRLFSDPDFFNRLIVDKLGDVMKDRADVKRFRNVLDKHSLEANDSRKKKLKASLMVKYGLTIKSDAGAYDKILRKVNSCDSKAELQQYKYYYFLKIQKLAKEIEEGIKDGDSELIKIYDMRLQVIHSAAESKLLSLVSADKTTLNSGNGGVGEFDTKAVPQIKLDLTLSQVLDDPLALSYFTEFMEQRRRTPLLQYWLIVNGVKNPLENLPEPGAQYDTDSEEEVDDVDVLGKDMAQADDIRQIFQQFFSTKLLKIDTKCYSNVYNFVSSKPYNPLLYYKARKSLLVLQQKVYERMNNSDYVAFKQSDLFLKLLATESQNQQRLHISESSKNLDDLQEDEEMNGDPIANYDEEDSGDEAKDDLKVSDAVLNAVENALTEIMNERPANFRVNSTSSTDFGSSSLGGAATSTDDLSNTFNSLNSTGSNTQNRNSRLVDKDVAKDLFGTDGSGLFDDNPSDSGIESDKMSSSRLFDSSNELFSDDESFINKDGGTDSMVSSAILNNPPNELSVAAPGALNLGDEIEKLDQDIERLQQQLLIIEPLLTKATLTNNVAELRILTKSKLNLAKELQFKKLQKHQYTVQENENSLYGKSKVSIQSYVSTSEDGKDFVLYIIEVQKLSSEDLNVVTAGWMVARRFSQFYKLHNYLRYKYEAVGRLEFPKRKVVMKFQQGSLTEERKIKLEAYLQSLVEIPEVCSDRLFRDFLSSEVFTIDLNESLQNVGPSAKKNVVNMTTKLYNRVSSQLAYSQERFKTTDNSDTSSLLVNEPETSELQNELSALEEYESDKLKDQTVVSFVKPICDLIVSIFHLDKSKSWLRGRAIVLVLQQLLGSTIEKMARVTIDQKIKQETTVSSILAKLQDILFPDGEFMKSGPERSIIEKLHTKHQARVIMEAFVIDSCSKVFGVEGSKYAADSVFQMLQNEILNTQLVLTLLEDVLDGVFPEINGAD